MIKDEILLVSIILNIYMVYILGNLMVFRRGFYLYKKLYEENKRSEK